MQETGNNTPQSINANTSRESTLLIEWSQDSVSHSIYNKKNNNVLKAVISDVFINLYDWTAHQFDRLLSEEVDFGFSYSKVQILINSPFMTLVPDFLFEKNKLQEILDFNIALPTTQLVFAADKIATSPYHLVYAYPLDLEKSLKNNFKEYTIQASNTSFLNHLMRSTNTSECLHLYWSTQSISLCYIKNRDIHFFNQFEYNSNEDILFNIINVYQQLELDTEKCPLTIAGGIQKNSTTHILIEEYIKHIKWQNRPVKLNYSEFVNEIPSHYFMTHFSHFL